MEAGMNDHISKPIMKGAIEETIIKWVDKKRETPRGTTK